MGALRDCGITPSCSAVPGELREGQSSDDPDKVHVGAEPSSKARSRAEQESSLLPKPRTEAKVLSNWEKRVSIWTIQSELLLHVLHCLHRLLHLSGQKKRSGNGFKNCVQRNIVESCTSTAMKWQL